MISKVLNLFPEAAGAFTTREQFYATRDVHCRRFIHENALLQAPTLLSHLHVVVGTLASNIIFIHSCLPLVLRIDTGDSTRVTYMNHRPARVTRAFLRAISRSSIVVPITGASITRHRISIPNRTTSR